ncbi:uncharacterized protein [Blastocystis hominis]|uniref:Ribosome recycling factor domain-containing protein n=1 Tax=Blastocystis hominis TaxID=12968 RepID=D8M381_BLAHO|nr:uncharacterized protein [Blastocystis hominis]CBK22354.2 unnamed protein product [Blastocystis hominis]|eukprot:XP_012896402.1 uncharacterized protein [Blastocystis hominis]
MIGQLKVELDGKSAVMSSIAQVAANTQISYLNLSFVVKTLKSSDLNLNPQIDKNSVRIQIPKTTKETRQKMIKQVALECEQQKSKLRAVRKRYMDKVRVIEKNVSISKDDISSMKKKIDEITDRVSKEMAEMMKRKEKELDI